MTRDSVLYNDDPRRGWNINAIVGEIKWEQRLKSLYEIRQQFRSTKKGKLLSKLREAVELPS